MLVELGLNRFRCDDCGKEVVVKGFPDGWIWLKPTVMKPVIEHRCPDCKDEVPTTKIGNR